MDITDSHDHDAFLRWTTLQQRPGGHFRIFDLEWVERVHPRKNVRGEFVVLHTPVWVNVLPLTADGKVVMVRQYRHGSDLVTLEFPGGVVAHGEEPAAAAMRECTEETGYASTPDKLVLVGEQLPNPAFMATRCYTYAWYD
ncbi:MAG: NUDIX hydrolase, partial [Chlorobi bacterium]|nr:NUDIX hydrolase [Chlorobiota bacterium]